MKSWARFFLLEEVNSASSRLLPLLSTSHVPRPYGLSVSCGQHDWLLFSQTSGSPCPFSADRVTGREGLAIPLALSRLGPQPWFCLRLAAAAALTLQPLFVGADPVGVLEGILWLLPPWWISFGEWGGPSSLHERIAAIPVYGEPIQIICCLLYVFA